MMTGSRSSLAQSFWVGVVMAPCVQCSPVAAPSWLSPPFSPLALSAPEVVPACLHLHEASTLAGTVTVSPNSLHPSSRVLYTG